jgi:hypothetical protein
MAHHATELTRGAALAEDKLTKLKAALENMGGPPVTPDATKPWGGLLPAPTSAAPTSWAPALAASVHTWSGIGYEVL